MRKLMFLVVLVLLGWFSIFCYNHIDAERKINALNAKSKMEEKISVLQFAVQASLENIQDKDIFVGKIADNFPKMKKEEIYSLLKVEYKAEKE